MSILNTNKCYLQMRILNHKYAYSIPFHSIPYHPPSVNSADVKSQIRVSNHIHQVRTFQTENIKRIIFGLKVVYPHFAHLP
jgi:hypothetical protein